MSAWLKAFFFSCIWRSGNEAGNYWYSANLLFVSKLQSARLLLASSFSAAPLGGQQARTMRAVDAKKVNPMNPISWNKICRAHPNRFVDWSFQRISKRGTTVRMPVDYRSFDGIGEGEPDDQNGRVFVRGFSSDPLGEERKFASSRNLPLFE